MQLTLLLQKQSVRVNRTQKTRVPKTDKLLKDTANTCRIISNVTQLYIVAAQPVNELLESNSEKSISIIDSSIE